MDHRTNLKKRDPHRDDEQEIGRGGGVGEKREYGEGSDFFTIATQKRKQRLVSTVA